MTKATWIQLAMGAAVAMGLVVATVWRAPSAPSTVSRAVASEPGPRVSIAETSGATQDSAPPASHPPAPAVASPEPLDEPSLMERLRRLAGADPARAVQLAREGNQRFPDSPEAPERTSILIHALAREGEASEARGTAEQMVNHYPDSSWVREIEQFTGAHRHRNLRLNADGGLEYY